MRRILVLLVVAGALATPLRAQDVVPVLGPPTALIGRWRACLTLEATHASGVRVPNAVCGDVVVSRDTFADIGVDVHSLGLRARHALDLAALFHSSRWPRAAGVTVIRRAAARADSAQFQLQLGATGGADNGSVVAWLGPRRDGLLAGRWEITCYACAGASGTIVMRKAP